MIKACLHIPRHTLVHTLTQHTQSWAVLTLATHLQHVHDLGITEDPQVCSKHGDRLVGCAVMGLRAVGQHHQRVNQHSRMILHVAHAACPRIRHGTTLSARPPACPGRSRAARTHTCKDAPESGHALVWHRAGRFVAQCVTHVSCKQASICARVCVRTHEGSSKQVCVSSHS